MKRIQLSIEEISTTVLPIGFEGEQNHVQITFYWSSIFNKYPSAVASLVIKPPVGDAYPKSITQTDNKVDWIVNASDLANPGSGEYQLTFSDNDEIIKSYIGKFNILDSIVGDGEAPTPVEDWIERANEALNGLGQQVTQDTNAWLNEHITNPDSPPLDRTLTSGSAAAPADMAGSMSDKVLSTAVSNISLTSANGVYRKSEDGKLVMYGTATGLRRLCFLNGQNVVKISTSTFSKTLEAGTYFIESDMTGYQDTYTFDGTYSSFSTDGTFTVVTSSAKTAVMTFTAPVMIGFRVIEGRSYGTRETPSYVTFTAYKLIAKDETARGDISTLFTDLTGIDALFGSVQYFGTPNKYTNDTPSKINLTQTGNIVLLNNTEATAETTSSTIRFYRLNDGIAFQSSANFNDDTLHTALKEGHTYRLFVRKLSGSVSSVDSGTIRLFVVDSNTASTGTDSPAFVNLLELTGGKYIDFVAGADYSINIVIRVINGILCTNYKLAVYLLDITESILAPTPVEQRNIALNLEDEPEVIDEPEVEDEQQR